MRSLSALLATVFVTIAFAACLDVGGSLDAPAPAWKSGYVYSFTEEGEFVFKGKQSGPDGAESGNQEETIGPVKVVYEVLNTTLQGAANEPVYLVALTREDGDEPRQPERVSSDASPVSISVPRSNIILAGARQRDLSDVGVGWRLEENCVNRVCQLALKDVVIGAGPSHTFLDFPLTKGKTWSGAIEDELEELGEASLRMKAEVMGKAKARTPLGSLETIRVDFEYYIADVDALKDKIRQDAKEEDVKIKDLDISVRAKVRAFYSPVYQNVVRVERDFAQNFRITGTAQGEDFSFAFENRVEIVRQLTGARLVAYPERDLAAIGRILTGDAPLGDPNGQALRPVGYSVRIEADKETLNAAAGEATSLQAVLTGVKELPAGHSASWSVRDPLGAVKAGPMGTSFALKPATPGVYVVMVETRDGSGNVTSAAALPITANFITTVKATCAQVVLSPVLTQGCQGTEAPVRPGIRSLKVSARIAGGVSQISQGELRLTDAAGTVTRTAQRQGDAYKIEMGSEAAFNLRGVTDKNWTLAYVPSRAVQETLEYSIELLYGDAVLVAKTPVRSANDLAARLRDAALEQRAGTLQ